MFGAMKPNIICGCYFFHENNRRYLPQVKAKAHTTILSTTSRTTLTQTFANPSQDSAVDEIRYVFPLYDGVSVVAFTCTVGSRVLKGVVKERGVANQAYNNAKARGETAGLLQQSPDEADVFTTLVGNVPAGETVVVNITFLGELNHDAEVDGIRFTIPTKIVPRYGPSQAHSSIPINEDGFTFTLDVEMPEGSAIESVQSPSHPLSVNIGTTSTNTDEPSLRRASATMFQSSTCLDAEFVLQVVATNVGEPAALLETHPTIPNQRAIMATLVPRFKLPTEKPEIVFICDRSGSMTGKSKDLVAALQIFLKSLPVGVKFNICSFGSQHDFLWPKSRTYDQDSLQEAGNHIASFSANYGGTNMYEPVEDTFLRRHDDMNLEVFLLTDGAISRQESFFKLINDKVGASNGSIRVFSLGVGSGASSSLIEGAARAGNGFAQTVGDNEKMDRKVVRMLKSALLPHIHDYSLEVKYEKAQDSDDDFELVEKVQDGLVIDTVDAPKETISLFNKDTVDDDTVPDAPDCDTKYDHLPKVDIPRYLQTPTRIPALFPFTRSTVYILLSDSTPEHPKSVLLKGTSSHGPLELEIPITVLAEEASTIHRLAARQEMKELEEGRGWLTSAKNSSGELFKTKHKGHFVDMVEREAVRLGTTYQVGGKWCSFVALEEKDADKKLAPADPVTHTHPAFPPATPGFGGPFPATNSGGGLFGSFTSNTSFSKRSSGASPDGSQASPGGGMFGLFGAKSSLSSRGGGLFGSAQAAVPPPPPPPAPAPAPAPAAGLFGSAQAASSQPPVSCGGLFGNTQTTALSQPPVFFGRFSGSAQSAVPPPPATSGGLFGGGDSGFGSNSQDSISTFGGASYGSASPFGGEESAPVSRASRRSAPEGVVRPAHISRVRCRALPGRSMADPSPVEPFGSVSQQTPDFGLQQAEPEDPQQTLTNLQTYKGYWSWSRELEQILGFGLSRISELDLPRCVKGVPEQDDILATACAVMYFRKKLGSEEEVWEMLVEKAESWLEMMADVEELKGVLEVLFLGGHG